MAYHLIQRIRGTGELLYAGETEYDNHVVKSAWHDPLQQLAYDNKINDYVPMTVTEVTYLRHHKKFYVADVEFPMGKTTSLALMTNRITP